MKIADALDEAVKFLSENRIAEPRRDANLLLGFVLNRDRAFLIAHNEDSLPGETSELFFNLISRRAKGEPIQYLTGKQEFFGLEFEVSTDVLIPRPETEILVEAALEILKGKENPYICDVGTGSGCIPISLLKNLENASAVALDISPEAIKVAERNAEKHGVSDRIEFYESDVFAVFSNPQIAIRNPQFEVIVSNPPYIPNKDLPGLPREVRAFEPHTALFGGVTGLEIVRKLLNGAPRFLCENGFLLFEIGYTQGEAVRRMIDPEIWRLRDVLDDLQGIPRIVVLQRV
ncbi:MAG TPA: peptide chain release factor N(5)-glutamine methyltransferase [Pyrinomonadaceae bacterium]|nr:peptide chain release factor N(5)-glutamine methyltransferase [Pyrinomonadaceae bacterium]